MRGRWGSVLMLTEVRIAGYTLIYSYDRWC
jgi:hypothetical protein